MRWQGGPMKSGDFDKYGELGENGEVGKNGESGKNSPMPLQDLPFSPLRTFLDINGLWL